MGKYESTSSSKKLMYIFLLISLNAIISKIIFLVRFRNAHDACINTYNMDGETKGSNHPNYEFMYCDGTKTGSMTGKCPDGTIGPAVDGVDSFDSLKFGISCDNTGEKEGDFSFGVCCTFWQCDQSVQYGMSYDSTFYVGYDEETLEKYSQYDCVANESCEAWCSDGIWTNNWSHANLRRSLYIATFAFAIIDLIVEGLCALAAFAYSVFGNSFCCTEPVQTSPTSFFILMALNATGSDELLYTVAGRFVLVIHLIDDLVSIGLVMPLIITIAKNGLNLWENQAELLYLFVSSCVEVLCFLKKIRVANAELGGPP